RLPSPVAVDQAHHTGPQPAAVLVGVINVHEAGLEKVRRQGQTQQSALPPMRHLDLGPRLRVDSAVTDDADASRPLSEEEAAVGGKLCFPRDLQISDHRLYLDRRLRVSRPASPG